MLGTLSRGPRGELCVCDRGRDVREENDIRSRRRSGRAQGVTVGV
jgi:hypothetical protein